MADLLAPRIDGPRALRAAMAQPGLLTIPGCHDALTARLVEEAGFPVAYMTGFGTSATLLGRADVGLLTQTEMVDNVRRIVSAIGIPLVADADTGYGNAINVIRTVQLYEQAGVAGLHIEDQVAPKKCGHMEGKQVVPLSEAVAKVRAAVSARHNSDLVLIARTDVRAVEGVDAAIERGKAFTDAGADVLFIEALQGEAEIERGRAFVDAGADVLFIEALQGEAEIERVATALAGHTLLFNWAEGGKTPPLPAERIAEMGFRIVICPIAALLTVTQAVRAAYAQIKAAGTPLPLVQGGLLGFGEFNDFIGLPDITAIERRFAAD